ncbi:MAG: ABC transporter ATP-binding protein [Elusimicrobiales bacterium]|nr:ABC transporter ATP-binding protein [Elusimicrobiales bacterium]
MPSLKVTGLTFSYGAQPLLREVAFELRPGDFMCVLGPNGSGKSTLLKLLTGFMKPAAGQVLLGGADTAGMDARRLAGLAAYVPSETTTPYDFSVRELVLLGRTARAGFWRGYSRQDEEAADRALAETGIAALAGRAVNSLSTGERQLAFIAQALAQEAKVLLLDEPTSHLDLKYKASVMALLAGLAARRLAVAAVLHEPALARPGCNKALLLGHGGEFSFGPAAQTLTRESLARLYGLPPSSPLLP